MLAEDGVFALFHELVLLGVEGFSSWCPAEEPPIAVDIGKAVVCGDAQDEVEIHGEMVFFIVGAEGVVEGFVVKISGGIPGRLGTGKESGEAQAAGAVVVEKFAEGVDHAAISTKKGGSGEFLEGGAGLRQGTRKVGIVGIEEADPISLGEANAFVHGIRLAAVGFGNQANVRMCCGKFADDRESGVGGSAVDDEMFERKGRAIRRDLGGDGGEALADVGGGVATGGDDGEMEVGEGHGKICLISLCYWRRQSIFLFHFPKKMRKRLRIR